MSKKFIYSLIAVFLISFFMISSSIGKKDGLLEVFKKFIPENIKIKLKNTFFVFKNQKVLKNTIIEQVQTINDLKIEKKELLDTMGDIPNLIGHIPLVYSKQQDFKILGKNYKLKKFKTSFLTIGKYEYGIGSSYLENFESNLIIGSANGIFGYVNFEDFNNDNLKINVIDSNIKDIITYDDFYKTSKYGIKDILIIADKIYVSYSNQHKKNCFNTSILVAKLNYSKLIFSNFFNPNSCLMKDKETFNAYHAGGRMVSYLDKEIFFTTGEWRYRNLAQDINSTFGKILSINIVNKEYKIISMGHRNPQGLFYDISNNILYSTEHGPNGGDEINVNNKIGGRIENYGWPISSYGFHYGSNEYDETNPAYIEAPLNKSHKKYGFIEPLKYYTPSIAISEIIKLNKDFNDSSKTELIVGSMGSKIEEGDLSLHHFTLEGDKIVSNIIIKLNERIRDMIYIKNINKIFMYLESTASIGILEHIK